jgi:aconitate hydratase
LLIAAGLLAQKANRLGLRPPTWVKTSLAPGSPSAASYLQRGGLLKDMEALGFGIVGYGCTSCIGNSGALLPRMSAHIRDGGIAACVLSGNRNFPGRVHSELSAGFLCSPPMVIAFALAGDVNRDIRRDAIGTGRDGTAVRLADIWPSADEIEAACNAALRPGDVASAFRRAQANAAWQSIEGLHQPRYPWEPASTYLQPPPFARSPSSSRLGRFRAAPLIVVGDDITTDHISPAGSIGPDQPAGRFLRSQGEKAEDLNVYASRRGNWQVMIRGLFGSAAVTNLLGTDIPPGCTLLPGGQAPIALTEAAERYRAAGRPVVVIGGYRFGQGSSRDWAAKGIAMLGTRAVLACSFERIHRANLIGTGVLPIELPEKAHPESLKLSPDDEIAIDVDPAKLRPHMPLSVALHGQDGAVRHIECRAAVETELEVETLRRGGTIQLIIGAAVDNPKAHQAS